MDSRWCRLQVGLVVYGLLSVVFVVTVSALDNMPANKDVSGLFPLTLIHINDLHARFEETNMKSNTCTDEDKKGGKCIAGIARVYHKIKELLKEHKAKNPIYLNAGDNYQGTLWYNLLRWNVTAAFITKLKPVAMTLGNHEFDHTPKGLAPYLAELEQVRIPTLVANLVKNGDKDLDKSKILPSIKLDVGGKKIGIIGVLYDKTHEIAQTGKVTLTSSVEAVKNEAAKLKKEGIDMIIVLSHCSYDEDKKIAQNAGEHIDVIVGAHSHSFLYSPESKKPYDTEYDKIEGPYPTIVEYKGRKIPIVQAKAYGKYVGRLTLYFDQKGEVKHWEGYPEFIDGKVPQDAQILEDLKPWRAQVKQIGSTVVGKTKVYLDRDSCRNKECTLGIVVADAFANQYTNTSFRPFAIIQAGNFRNPIKEGDITNGDIIEAAPFGSTADLIKLKGEDIWNVAEHSFALDDEGRTNCLQVSGLRIVIDPSKKIYSRVVKIEVTDQKNPKSDALKPLDKKAEYYVVSPSYLADGKDGFVAMKKATARWSGPLDSDVFKSYIEKIKTVENLKMGRVVVCKDPKTCKANHYFFVVILFVLWNNGCIRRRITSTKLDATFITINEIDFKSNADYIKVFVRIRNGTDELRASTVADIDTLVYKNVSAGLQVRIDLASKIGLEYVSLMDSNVDMCMVNQTETDDVLLKMMISEIAKHGNMSIGCPFESGNYMVRNFHIDTDNEVVKLAPSGDYRVGIDVKHKDEGSRLVIPIFDMQFYVTIVAEDSK